MRPSNPAYQGIDDLRALSTLAVILLHTSAGRIDHFGGAPLNEWITAFIYNTISRFAVPIFVMISGALLLSKEYTLKQFVTKRISRIVYPFLFYASLYIAYYLIVRLAFGHQNNLMQTVEWLVALLRKGVVYHFWYVYMILSLYLFTPILRRWIQSCKENEIVYFLLLWMCSNIMTFPLFKEIHFKVELSHFAGYIGYFVLGYYLSNKKFEQKRHALQAGYMLFIIGIAVTLTPTIVSTIVQNAPSPLLISYFYPNLIAMVSGLYLIFRLQVVTLAPWIWIRDILCKHSFGIYLIHILVLKWLSMAGIHWNFAHPIVAIPATAILCTLISTLLVIGFSKLPFGKWIKG